MQVIHQVGDHDRVDHERHAAVDEQTRQRHVGQVAECGDHAPRERGTEGRDRERETAVAGVREAPHRPLQQRTTDDRGGHQQADVGGVEADAFAIHRGQAPERAHRQPRGQRADEGRRRCAPDQAQLELGLVADLRLRKTRHRHRQQRQAHENRRDREQDETGRRVQAQQLLRAGERGEVHHHVHRKHLAAALGRGAVVEPALDHRIEADQAHAGEHAQAHPEPGMDHDRVEQDAARDRGAEEGEGADVAHAPDQPRRDEGAEEEAEEVGRADEAEGVGREAFQAAAQRDDGVDQAGAEQQQGDAGEQRADGDDGWQHERDFGCRPRPSAGAAPRRNWENIFSKQFNRGAACGPHPARIALRAGSVRVSRKRAGWAVRSACRRPPRHRIRRRSIARARSPSPARRRPTAPHGRWSCSTAAP